MALRSLAILALAGLTAGLAACAREAPSSELPASTPTFMIEGAFELETSAGERRRTSWSDGPNLVDCRYDPRPEGGDYLWVRLAESPEQGGDAGPRLDIDVCRIEQLGSALPLMPAGQHGSACADTPGFAIWWHEGEAAYNSGDLGEPPERCELELELDHLAGAVRGRFECGPLRPAADGLAHDQRWVAAGSFVCPLEAMDG